jgi:hypothetical protein
MDSKFIILAVLFAGLILITISLTRNSTQCPKAKIVYRYIPKTFEEEQAEPVYVSDIFKTMFSQKSPWIRSVESLDLKKTESVNKYFASQY